jgi:hypothetical protein
LPATAAAGADADDEDDDDYDNNEGAPGGRDSGIGTSYSEAGSATIRKRSSKTLR